MIFRCATVLTVLTAAGILAGSASAAATHVAPTEGAALATSHPVFQWTLPPNEESDAIYIANRPETTPEGQFYDENVVDLDVFFNDERQWSPSSPLYAGFYWWLVWSNDRNTYHSYYSTPSGFRIKPAATLVSVRTHRYTSLHWLDVTVRWKSNVHAVRTKVRLVRHGKTVWSRSDSDTNIIGYAWSTSFTWHRPRGIRQGTPLTLYASVIAGGVKKTRAVIVRAP